MQKTMTIHDGTSSGATHRLSEGGGIFNFITSHLSVRLTAMFLAVAVIPMVGLGVLSYVQASRALRDLALSNVAQDAAARISDIQTFQEQFFSDLLTIADGPPTAAVVRARDNGGVDPITGDSEEVWMERLTQISATMMHNKQFYQQTRFIDQDGNESVGVDYFDGEITPVTGTDALQSRLGDPSFDGARDLQKGEVFISEMKLDRVGGELRLPHTPIIRYSTPVQNAAGEFRGVMVTTVLANSILDRLALDNGEIFLAGEQLEYLLNPDSSKTFSPDLGTDFNVDQEFGTLHDGVRAAQGQPFAAVVDGQVGSLQVLWFDPLIPDRHWLVVRTLPENEVLAPVNDLGRLMVIVAVAVAIVVGIVAWLMARGISRPISRFGAALRKIATGDLTADLTVNSRDEIGEMAVSYCEMRENLNDLIGDVRRSAETVGAASSGLKDVSQDAGDATDQIAHAAQEVAKGATDQVAVVAAAIEKIEQMTAATSRPADEAPTGDPREDATRVTMGSMVRAIESVAENAGEAVEASRDAESAATAGAEAVQRTIARMSSIRETVSLAAANIRDLGERSEEIGNIVGVINHIADQTNLLALNAAIEAARAGDAGRGFAVVAEEVRRLSERTSLATDEIVSLVRSVQDGTSEAAQGIEAGAQEVVAGADVAAEAGNSLESIREAVSRTAGQVSQISLSAEQLAVSTDHVTAQANDVNASMESISALLEETSAASEQSSASTDQLSRQMSDLAVSAEELNSLAGELSTAVDAFQLDETASVEILEGSPDDGRRLTGAVNGNARPSAIGTSAQ